MFNVKALVGGVLCLDLEEGAINIRQGQIVNLDSYCSREWISTNPQFRSLIDRKIIMVLFDSTVDRVPKVNLTGVSRKPSTTPTVPVRTIPARQSQLVAALPKVNLPAPISDTVPVVIDLATNTVTESQIEVLLEPATLAVEEIDKKYTEPELRKMYLNDLKLLAASLNINVVPPISKIRLVRSILKQYDENVGSLAANM
jgi:hypothetical protein